MVLSPVLHVPFLHKNTALSADSEISVITGALWQSSVSGEVRGAVRPLLGWVFRGLRCSSSSSWCRGTLSCAMEIQRLRLLLRLSVLDRTYPRPTSSQTVTSSLSALNASATRKCSSCRRLVSSQTVSEVLDVKFFTVGVKRFSYVGSVVPA